MGQVGESIIIVCLEGRSAGRDSKCCKKGIGTISSRRRMGASILYMCEQEVLVSCTVVVPWGR